MLSTCYARALQAYTWGMPIIRTDTYTVLERLEIRDAKSRTDAELLESNRLCRDPFHVLTDYSKFLTRTVMEKQKQKGPPSTKLRGLPKDSLEIRVSKTLSWILRHGAKSEGLYMRPDGFVRVTDLVSARYSDHVSRDRVFTMESRQLASPKLQTQLDFAGLEKMVQDDEKMRYTMMSGPDEKALDAGDIWWIRANHGHSMEAVKIDLKPILSASDIPMAVHGTNKKAWSSISKQGLSKMTRNHIHLAQGVPGNGVISGMRNSASVLIYIDVQKALDAGILFFLSDNGVVLTEGDSRGFLSPEFFSRVENRYGKPLPGWQPATAVDGNEEKEAEKEGDIPLSSAAPT
ncbi:hypothetical protein EVG20_g542 [Dentipellis fragilis]|uniref:2'-phosphotransferase n=1 Tax=Dentipellis fragilis TaxID=205917 RepID=A0A4Y9ZCF1_9AGAM|nr:hypothetical protein EVG20_g542 [Dentipellis fragilis]